MTFQGGQVFQIKPTFKPDKFQQVYPILKLHYTPFVHKIYLEIRNIHELTSIST